MRRLFLIVVAVALASFAHAQISNVTVKVQWAPNPASEAVMQYTLVVDSGAPLVVLPASCTATVCEQSVTLSFATHTFSLTATNEWGTSPASTATANLSIPAAPTNLRIVR
jgi:hypothetical protein